MRPDADGIANSVGDRRCRRNRRDFADTNATTEYMIETALVEVDVDNRRISDSGYPVVLKTARQNFAGRQIDFAIFVKGITDSLDHRPGCLASRERRSRDLADGNSGVDVDDPHMPKPSIYFDFDHLDGTWNAGSDCDIENRRIIQPNTVPIKPASLSGERIAGDVGLPSSGRSADTMISGDAASNSRQGALEPRTGLRFACRSTASLSF